MIDCKKMYQVPVTHAAESKFRRKDMSRWTMTLASVAIVVAIGSMVFGTPVSPITQATGSSAVIKTVTYLSAGGEEAVWIAVSESERGRGHIKTVLYRGSLAGAQWRKVLEVAGHGPLTQLWVFELGRMVAQLNGGLSTSDLIYRTGDGGIRWDSSPAPRSPLGGSGFGSFINLAEGWMLVATGAGMHQVHSVLYHTLDGGVHWTKVADSDPLNTSGLTTTPKTGMVFRDANRGWMGTDLSGFFMPYLFMTSDGGATWKLESLPPPPGKSDDWAGAILSPRFFGAQAGVAVALLTNVWQEGSGLAFQRTPYLYQTSDGGLTWGSPRPIPVAEILASNFLPYLPWDVLSPTIWAAAWNRTLWLSFDAGRTWSEHSVSLPPTYRISRVIFAGPAQVWVIGSEGRPSDRESIADDVFLKSMDAGVHWMRVALPQVR